MAFPTGHKWNVEKKNPENHQEVAVPLDSLSHT